MTFSEAVLLIFHGGIGGSTVERLVGRARIAAARGSAGAALAAGFEAVIVATDDPRAFDDVPSQVLIESTAGAEPFDFSKALRGLIKRYGIQKPAVMGSGSVPLLGLTEFQMVVEQLEQRDARFITNNFFSADLTAWTPGDAIFAIGDFARDNVLPRRLRDDAGLSAFTLPRTTSTQFDLDTPSDLAVLALQERLEPSLRAVMAEAEPLASRYRAVLPLLCDRMAEIVVAGRVGSQAWQYLERETACRVRVISEERGMAAAGSERPVRSVLGFLVEELGPERFFERMAELGDALFLDSRVICAHLGIEASAADRFESDLFAWERVEEPWLRRFTKAAAEAPKPVLLGGHSLVSGGLMALNDVAWTENDRREGIVQ